MIPLRDDNPTSIVPWVTIFVIILCILAFLWELSVMATSDQVAITALSFIPSTLLAGRQIPVEIAIVPPSVTLITSMFLHGGWMHLIGNMLYLWIFGNNVEDAMGHKRFIVFYLVCGVIAALAHGLPNPNSDIPTLGASGAISGILGAYLLLYPHARVLVFIPLGFLSRAIYLPAGWALGFWFAIQLVSSASSDSSGGGVAWGAHIGGFVAGMLLIPFFRYKNVPLFHPRNSRDYKR